MAVKHGGRSMRQPAALPIVRNSEQEARQGYKTSNPKPNDSLLQARLHLLYVPYLPQTTALMGDQVESHMTL